MAADNKGINYAGIGWVRELGYPAAQPPMQSEVSNWWGWYRSKGDFYRCAQTSADGMGTFKVERISFNPAKMVCEDWAGILFNYRTSIGLEGVTDLDDNQEAESSLQAVHDWICQWAKDTCLLTDATTYERCFGLGTTGFALGLDGVRTDGLPDADTRVTLRRYDARSIVPLSWNEGVCTEAAFVSQITHKGKAYTQWVAYTVEDSKRTIHTAHFLGNGKRVELDGFSTKITLGAGEPLFVLLRPAIDNTYADHGPFGVSVFDGALGAIKLADGSFDNTWRDVYLGQKMLFVPEDMLRKNDDGTYTVARAEDQQLFMAKGEESVGEKGQGVDEYNPDLRISDNRLAIDTALALLGKRCGFGMKYYSLDEAGNPKTAKEVGADNAELMRNAKKHEQAMGSQLSHLCEAAVELANTFCAAGLPDVTGKVCVLFGDTIIQDEDTERERMRADVAASLVPAWKYVMTYYGVSRETAIEWTEPDVSEVPTEA